MAYSPRHGITDGRSEAGKEEYGQEKDEVLGHSGFASGPPLLTPMVHMAPVVSKLRRSRLSQRGMLCWGHA